jgi:hypothetical protein
MNFREIFGVDRFSTFATVSGPDRTFTEPFSFPTSAVTISVP